MKDLKRAVAVHIDSKSKIDTIENIKASAGKLGCEVVMFYPNSIEHREPDIKTIDFPDEADNIPKQKNFILKWFKERGFSGFLHLVESSILFNDSTKNYMDKLESVMSALDYDVHLSTVTDRCNYVFNKFCPRLSLDVDDIVLKFKLDLPDKIYFTSHSNVSYVAFNFAALGEDVPMFDERFTVGMFYIIEFLARRRATRKPGQLYYMNQYLSISDEVGAYDIISADNSDIDQEVMQRENELFKSLDIHYEPDNNIDIVLDALYSKLKLKLANH